MTVARPFKAGIRVPAILRRVSDVMKDDLNCLFIPSLRDGKIQLGWPGPALKDRAKIMPTLRVDETYMEKT